MKSLKMAIKRTLPIILFSYLKGKITVALKERGPEKDKQILHAAIYSKTSYLLFYGITTCDCYTCSFLEHH